MINYQIILTEAEIRALTDEQIHNEALFISSDTQKLFTFINGELVTLSLNMSEMQGTIKLKGIVETVDKLPATTTFVGGELYLVGTEAPYLEYVYSITAGEYIKFGEVVDVPSTYVDSVDILDEEVMVLSHSTDKCDDVSINITEPKATFDIPGTIILGSGLAIETVDDEEDTLVAKSSEIVEFAVPRNHSRIYAGVPFYPKGDTISGYVCDVQSFGSDLFYVYSRNYGTTYGTDIFFNVRPIKILEKYYILAPDLELQFEHGCPENTSVITEIRYQVWTSIYNKNLQYTNNTMVKGTDTHKTPNHFEKFKTFLPCPLSEDERLIEIPVGHINSLGYYTIRFYVRYNHDWNVGSTGSGYRIPCRHFCIAPVNFKWELYKYKDGSYNSAQNKPTIDGVEFNGEIFSSTQLKYDDTQTIKQYLDTLNSVTYDRNILYTTSTATPVTKYNSYKWRLDGRSGASNVSSSYIPASWRNKNYFPNMDLTFTLGDSTQTTTLYAWYVVKY